MLAAPMTSYSVVLITLHDIVKMLRYIIWMEVEDE